MKASLIYWGLMGNMESNWGKTEPKVCKESGRGRRKRLVWGMLGLFHSFRANANVSLNLQQHLVPFLRSSPSQPSQVVQDSPRHTSQRLLRFLETQTAEPKQRSSGKGPKTHPSHPTVEETGPKAHQSSVRDQCCPAVRRRVFR